MACLSSSSGSTVVASTTWGAYPEHDIYDIRSGLDVVHNTYMLDKVEKSVVYCPFRQFPKPPYFLSHRSAHRLGHKLTKFEASPSPLALPGIFVTALGS